MGVNGDNIFTRGAGGGTVPGLPSSSGIGSGARPDDTSDSVMIFFDR